LGWILAMEFPLELQSAGTRGVGERLHPPVVAITGTVERDRGDSFFLRLGGDALADQLGGLEVAAVLHLRAHFLFRRRSGGEHLVALRGSDLRVDVAVRAMHGEAHCADLANPDPGLARASLAGCVFV